MKIFEVRVKTGNPKALDATVQHFGAAVVEGSFDGEACDVRVFGDLSMFNFVMRNQGYGEIISEREIATEEPSHA